MENAVTSTSLVSKQIQKFHQELSTTQPPQCHDMFSCFSQNKSNMMLIQNSIQKCCVHMCFIWQWCHQYTGRFAFPYSINHCLNSVLLLYLICPELNQIRIIIATFTLPAFVFKICVLLYLIVVYAGVLHWHIDLWNLSN